MSLLKKTGGNGEQPLLLLSAEALADRLGFSARTIWRLRSAGKLPPSLKIGGSIRWRSREIDAWIEADVPMPKPGRPVTNRAAFVALKSNTG